MVKQIEVHSCHGILCSDKNKELFAHITTWMNLQGIILSEESQSQKVVAYIV